MIRSSLALCIALGLASTASAGWADGLFEELSRDFGSVPRGPMLTHPFRVKNTTNAPLHISGVRVSCGCTTAWPLVYDIPPGKETVIMAQMDTRRFVGSKTVTIFITFDQPRFEEVRLWISANSRDDVAVAPDTLAFGRVKHGASPSASTNISFLGNGQWQITSVASESHYVLPQVQQIRRDASEVAYQLTAKLRPDTPPGRWFTDLWLNTNNPTTPKVRIPVTVEVEASLSASPSSVSLGQLKVGQAAERRVVISGVAPFRIVTIEGTDNNVTVRDSTNERKNVHVLIVNIRQTNPGDLTRIIRVKTDMPGENEVEFNALAKVVP